MSIAIEGTEKVDQSQLRVGDVILPIPKNGEVVLTTSDSDGDVETSEKYYDPERYDFYLVKRAPIVLPDKVGSVVRVGDPIKNASRWMLTDAETWVSSSGYSKTKDHFQEYITDFNVEVIA